MKRLTNSEVSTWRECRRKWYLSTHRRLQRRGKNDFNKPLGIGSRVHDALAAYYIPGERNDPVGHVRLSVARDLEEFPAYADDISKEGDLAERMVEGYVQWLEETGSDADLEVMASEEPVEAVLLPGEATLLAKLDAIVRRRDKLFSLEHKTGASGVEPRILQINAQFLTQHLVEYLSLLEREEEGAVSDGVIVNMLKKSKRTERAKGPFYWREEVRHGVPQLRSHWKHVVAYAHEIIAAEELLRSGADHHDVCPPSPGGDCSWKCAFVGVCASMDDGSAYEELLEGDFETHDPLERYAV